MSTLNVATKPLGLKECVPLTEAQQLRLEKLERYDMWFVAERLADNGLLPEELIPETIAEYKRFLALIVLGHRGFDVPSAEVDEVWHAHILFTPEYADLCEQLGAGFIHHVPHTRRSPHRSTSGTSYWGLYGQLFGQPLSTMTDGTPGHGSPTHCGGPCGVSRKAEDARSHCSTPPCSTSGTSVLGTLQTTLRPAALDDDCSDPSQGSLAHCHCGVSRKAEDARSHCHSNCHSCHQCHGCGISATLAQVSNARARCYGNCYTCSEA